MTQRKAFPQLFQANLHCQSSSKRGRRLSGRMTSEDRAGPGDFDTVLAGYNLRFRLANQCGLQLRYNPLMNRVFDPDETLSELPLPSAFVFGWPRNSGIAARMIWKAHPWARGCAIVASVPFLFIFVRPFLIPMHAVLDHNLLAFVVGVAGICAFVWPD